MLGKKTNGRNTHANNARYLEELGLKFKAVSEMQATATAADRFSLYRASLAIPLAIVVTL